MPTFSFFSRARRARISFSVKSGSAALSSTSHCSCFFSRQRSWPVRGMASTLPVVVQRLIQRIAVEAPRSSTRAASRALSPLSTIETTRTRRSFEYAIEFGLHLPSEAPESDLRARGNPPVTELIHFGGKPLYSSGIPGVASRKDLSADQVSIPLVLDRHAPAPCVPTKTTANPACPGPAREGAASAEPCPPGALLRPHNCLRCRQDISSTRPASGDARQ